LKPLTFPLLTIESQKLAFHMKLETHTMNIEAIRHSKI
jgi:hypothetical protein